jgi:hypothetical protein
MNRYNSSSSSAKSLIIYTFMFVLFVVSAMLPMLF